MHSLSLIVRVMLVVCCCGLMPLAAVAQPLYDWMPVPESNQQFSPWVMNAAEAQRVITVVLTERPEVITAVLNQGEVEFAVIAADDDLIILQPNDPVNKAHVDNIVIRYHIELPEEVALLDGIISTYGGTFIISESYAADGTYSGGVVAAIDGTLVSLWEPGDDIQSDYGQWLVAANRAMGVAPDWQGIPSEEDAVQLANADQSTLQGWVITHAEAQAIVQQVVAGGDAATGFIQLTLSGHQVDFMAFQDQNTIALTPVNPFNEARIDGVIIDLWVNPDAVPPVQTLLSTYAGTIIINESYQEDGTFDSGVVARVDGELLRSWEPQDQYTVSLDDLLFMAGNASRDLADAGLGDEAIRGGADIPTIITGVDDNGIDDGAVNDGNPGVISNVGGI